MVDIASFVRWAKSVEWEIPEQMVEIWSRDDHPNFNPVESASQKKKLDLEHNDPPPNVRNGADTRKMRTEQKLLLAALKMLVDYSDQEQNGIAVLKLKEGLKRLGLEVHPSTIKNKINEAYSSQLCS